MKTLKESILSRSSHNGESFKAQRRNEIEKWLKKYNIKNYTINDDFTIDVNGSIDLFFSKDLSEFPDYIQFGVVKGFFKCIHSQLTSLRGCPRKIEKFFDCRYNKLTSLEGAPEEVVGDFVCSHNSTTFTVEDVRRVCDVKGSILTGLFI